MADYVEIVGRAVRPMPDRVLVRTLGVASTATDANRPVQGSTLDIGTVIAAIYVSQQVDETRYPQRFLFVTEWEAPILASE